MGQAIGVDLGGSHVMATVVDENGETKASTNATSSITHRPRCSPPPSRKWSAKRSLNAKEKQVVGIGIGAPGNIDLETGTIRYSPNFGWKDVALGDQIRGAFKFPVFVANDARCATLGEHTFGAGKGVPDFVLLTLGTGIGGGIVSGGRLLLGGLASAGEIGHHQIRPHDGFVCGCTKIGCFEAQCSGRA